MSRVRFSTLIAALVLGLGGHRSAAAQESGAPACFVTGGGALEICRSGGEAEGVLLSPRSCAYARSVQILRLGGGRDQIQTVYQGEGPVEVRRGSDPCPADLRALNPLDGGAVRTATGPEQLATAMGPSEPRLWEMVRSLQGDEDGRTRPRQRRARQRPSDPQPRPAASQEEGVGARDPMTVAGRDWAGDPYYYVFLLATAATEAGNRHALIQARTVDFTRFDIRARTDGDTVDWTAFATGETEPGKRARRRTKPDNPSPAAVLDEAGRPIVGNCPGQGFDARGLVGSISVVAQTYHYFYADVLPSDCAEPASRRRMGLYLRTSRDLAAERVWSAPRLLVEPLPPETLVRVARAKGQERWAVAYTCNRPANAPGGPVADLCVQYTADLSLDGLKELPWFAEPLMAKRSPTYLGLRSGGDGGGRFARTAHFWMTDRYGNLDVPANYSGKAGFLTWQDRTAPRQDGSDASSLYGRPAYWATWTTRAVGAR